MPVQTCTCGPTSANSSLRKDKIVWAQVGGILQTDFPSPVPTTNPKNQVGNLCPEMFAREEVVYDHMALGLNPNVPQW